MDNFEAALEAVPTERGALLSSAQAVAEQAARLVVTDEASFRGASQALVEVATIAKRLEEARKAETRPLVQEKARIDASYKGAFDTLINARTTLEQATGKWQREQEAKRLAIQRADEERARKEMERLAKLEQKAVARGDMAKADEYNERQALAAMPNIIPSPAPAKAEGVSKRTVWKFRVVDAAAIPGEYLVPDLEAIGRVVRALGERARIAGVEVYSEEITTVRTK